MSEKWTPSPGIDKNGMYKSAARVGQRVVDLVPGSEGEEDTEVSEPHAFWERWIDTAGNVMNVAMMSNRGPNYDAKDREVYSRKRATLLAAKWLSFDFGDGYEPPGAWLHRRDKVLAERKAKHNAKQAVVARKYESERDAFKQDLVAALRDFKSEDKSPRSSKKNPGLE